jgi:hypothetical protein
MKIFLSLAGRRENKGCALWAAEVFASVTSVPRRTAETRTEIALWFRMMRTLRRFLAFG